MERVRTTLSLPRSVFEDLRKMAFEQRKSMSEVVSESISEAAVKRPAKSKGSVKLPSYGTGGFVSGFDPFDEEARDKLEAEEWSSQT